MRRKRTAWVTENTAREQSLITVGGTVAGAILYALVASSCGVAPDGDDATIANAEVAAAPDIASDVATAPAVTAVLPADGSTSLSETVVRVVFSVSMADGAEAAFSLSQGESPVAGDLAWDTTRTVLAFRPAAALAVGDYTLAVDAAAAAADGATLAAPYVASFTVTAGGAQKH